MPAGINIKVLLVVSVVLVALLGLCFLAMLSTSKNGEAPGIISSTASGSQVDVLPNLVGLQDPEVAARFKLVGVKPDDTVAVIDPVTEDEIVVNIDHYRWKLPTWSPDNKLLAVLGSDNQEKPDVFDLFIYELAAGKWTKATNYSVTNWGITGYAWLDGTRLVFTQGSEGNSWLHRYDYPNQELRKEFQTSLTVVEAQLEKQRLVMVENDATKLLPVSYSLLGFNNKLVHRFLASDLEVSAQLVNVHTTNSPDFYLVQVYVEGESYFYIWDLQQDDYLLVDLAGISNPEVEEDTLEVPQAEYSAICTQVDKGMFMVEKKLPDNAFNLVIIDPRTQEVVSKRYLDVLSSEVTDSYPKFFANCGSEESMLGVVELDRGAEQPMRWYLVKFKTAPQYIGRLDGYLSVDLAEPQ